MLSDEIVKNELHIPCSRTLDTILVSRDNRAVDVTSLPLKQGSYGRISYCQVSDTEFEFIEKNAIEDLSAIANMKNEMHCNQLVSRYTSSIFAPLSTVDVFLKIGAAFVGRYITSKESVVNYFDKKYGLLAVPSRQLFFEYSLGSDLESKKFLHVSEVSTDDPEERKNLHGQFLSDNLRITAQVFTGLAHIHQSGVVHRDLKLANLVYDFSGKNIKIIDFGLGRSYEPFQSDDQILLASYCGSIEEYKVAQRYADSKNSAVMEDFFKLNAPTCDIYSMGILLISIFFRNIGREYILGIFVPIGHVDYAANVKARDDLYETLENKLQELNGGLPSHLRYSEEELQFVTRLIKSCLDPDPTKRPTAAQSGGICELFAAGMKNFEQNLQYMQELRPSPEVPQELSAIYWKYNLTQIG